MKMLKSLIALCVVCFVSNVTHAALITMEVNEVCMVSDFDQFHQGNELRIDYLVTNTTLGDNLDDALYRILLPAGISQTVYSVQVPEEWVAVVTQNDIELYTLNGFKAIQCGEAKSFSLFAHNIGTDTAEIRAMTSIGDWAIPETACVPNGEVPEPAMITLFSLGVYLLRRRPQSRF